MSEYQLGDRVRFTGQVVKRRELEMLRYRDAPLPTNGRYGTEERTYDEGVIVGRRSLQEGSVHHSYYDPAVFVRDFARPPIRVYLVAFGIYRKPIMCRDDQLEGEG